MMAKGKNSFVIIYLNQPTRGFASDGVGGGGNGGIRQELDRLLSTNHWSVLQRTLMIDHLMSQTGSRTSLI